MSTANILVVDDEADIRTLIEEILTDEGYQVATAGDAAEAREQLVSSQPDLVLLVGLFTIWLILLRFRQEPRAQAADREHIES